jgi:hypothetical protein
MPKLRTCPSIWCVCGKQRAGQGMRFVGRANRPDEPRAGRIGRQRLGRDASPYLQNPIGFLSRQTSFRTPFKMKARNIFMAISISQPSVLQLMARDGIGKGAEV